jgi:hypothetical protein
MALSGYTNVKIATASKTYTLRGQRGQNTAGFLRGSFVTTSGSGIITYYDAINCDTYVNRESQTITSHQAQTTHNSAGIDGTRVKLYVGASNKVYAIVPAGLEIAGSAASLDANTGTFTFNASDAATSCHISYYYEGLTPNGPVIAVVLTSPTVNTQIVHNAGFATGLMAVTAASSSSVTAQIEF